MKQRTLSFRGHLWALGKADDELHAKQVDDEGREWFAITAFPLFAGTFGTIASALNLCAIVQPWKCVLGGKYSLADIKDVPDPKWLVATNYVSLFFGIVSNIAALLMRGDSSFPLGKYLLQLVFISIVSGYIASFILVALVVAAFRELRTPPPPQHAFTEAYYYAIEAAGLYFITSSFVIYTAYMLWHSRRTRDDLSKQFAGGHLSLKILTIVFMSYILIGALVFSRIENWRYLDGVFWADVTILTVGFGDFKPATHLGRSLLIPYAALGIFFLFLILYCITQVVFERGSSLWEARLRDQERRREVQRRTSKRLRISKKQTPEVQPPVPSFLLSRVNSGGAVPTTTQPAHNDSADLEKLSKSRRKLEARERRREDFEKMQEIAMNATGRRIYLSIGLWLLFSVFLWIGGAVLFYLSERDQGWTYFNAIYFTFISLLTIGYGDNNLLSMPGKAIFVLWSLIVIPSLTMLISTGTELVGMPYLTRTKNWVRHKLSRNKKDTSVKMQHRLSNDHDPSSPLMYNTHDKNHLIVQAIKSIAKDHIQNQVNGTQSTYSFEDWEYIFYLMGILDPSEEERANRLARLNEARQSGSENEGERIPERPTRIETWQGDGEILDWLHGKNPLNVSETLTEWMLLTLVERLEGELAELRRNMGNTPISGSTEESRRGQLC